MGVRWASAIGLPPVDCGIAYIHLRCDISNPELLFLASFAKVRPEGDLAWHVSVSSSAVRTVLWYAEMHALTSSPLAPLQPVTYEEWISVPAFPTPLGGP